MRTIASIMFVIDEVRIVVVYVKDSKPKWTLFQVLFLPIVIYVPALAFNQGIQHNTYSTKVFAGIKTITVSIVCLFFPISVTGANIYLIGGVVCIVCVFYTLVVSAYVFKSFLRKSFIELAIYF